MMRKQIIIVILLLLFFIIYSEESNDEFMDFLDFIQEIGWELKSDLRVFKEGLPKEVDQIRTINIRRAYPLESGTNYYPFLRIDEIKFTSMESMPILPDNKNNLWNNRNRIF